MKMKKFAAIALLLGVSVTELAEAYNAFTVDFKAEKEVRK